jgi:hypothetical protein
MVSSVLLEFIRYWVAVTLKVNAQERVQNLLTSGEVSTLKSIFRCRFNQNRCSSQNKVQHKVKYQILP